MDWKIFLTIFGAVFIAELGDKTQLATMLFAADKEVSKTMVFVAASAALVVAAAMGVLVGSLLSEFINQKYLHYILGRNTLSMVYLSSMQDYGGEHSVFQFYHSWFSYTGGDGDHGNATYNGKPPSVVEPFYPYHVSDTQTSTYGPAPGFLVGGPNYYYSAQYSPPAGVARLLQTAFIPYYRPAAVAAILDRLALLAEHVPFHTLSYQLGEDVLELIQGA